MKRVKTILIVKSYTTKIENVEIPDEVYEELKNPDKRNPVIDNMSLKEFDNYNRKKCLTKDWLREHGVFERSAHVIDRSIKFIIED